jgi:hypothetical protein
VFASVSGGFCVRWEGFLFVGLVVQKTWLFIFVMRHYHKNGKYVIKYDINF